MSCGLTDRRVRALAPTVRCERIQIELDEVSPARLRPADALYARMQSGWVGAPARDQAPAVTFIIVGFAGNLSYGGPDGRALTYQIGIAGKLERHVGVFSLQLVAAICQLHGSEIICFKKRDDC
jgi:hypothetical protein